MRRMSVPVAVALVCVIARAPLLAQKRPPADRRNFLACPVVRDTATVPCYLAEMDGELYFLGIQRDTSAAWYPPQLKHKVLVEGTVSNEARVCGGIVLKELTTSVLPEIDASCNTILPAEAGIEAPHAERGPGPSSERPRQGGPPSAPPARPVPPFAVREFTLPFDFDNDFIPIRVTRIVSDAVRYVKDTNAARVEVTSFRGATLLSNGHVLTENPLVVERRAKKLDTVLRGLGVPVSALVVSSRLEAPVPDGVNDPSTRRVTIVVKP